MPDNQSTSSTETAGGAPAGRGQRVLTFVLWMGMIGAMIGVIGGKILYPHRDIAMLFPAASYSLIDQSGKTFSDADLRGKAYVCDFIFTTCGSACPLMTSKMEGLQRRLPGSVQFVSFSVNPEYDTPPVLKEYAKANHADEARWHFLTGTHAQMFEVARQMHVAAESAKGDQPLMHDEHFLLVDGDGNVRGVYDSNDPQLMNKLVEEATYVAHSRGARG